MKRLILILSFIFTVVSLSSCREEQEHQHIYSAQWQTSESHHWKRCQDQECDSRIATSEHSFDDIMPLGNGNTKYTCSVCSYEKITHEHTLATEYTNDSNFHWFECIYDGCDHYGTKTEHSYGDEILDSDGLIHTVCTVCQYESTAIHNHDFSSSYDHNADGHYYLCTYDGCDAQSGFSAHSYESSSLTGENEIFVCEACGREENRTHVHSYTGAIVSLTSGHYYSCITEGCTSHSETLEHEWSSPTLLNGYYVYTCTVCEYTKSENHAHTLSQDWKTNDDEHWKACTVTGCLHTELRAEHTWESTGTVTEPTPDKNGEEEFICSVCQLTKIVEIEYTAEKMSETEWLSYFVFDNLMLENSYNLFGEDYTDVWYVDGDTVFIVSGDISSYTTADALREFAFLSDYYDDFTVSDGGEYFAGEIVYYDADIEEEYTFKNVRISFSDTKILRIEFTVDLGIIGETTEVYDFIAWGGITIPENPREVITAPESIGEMLGYSLENYAVLEMIGIGDGNVSFTEYYFDGSLYSFVMGDEDPAVESEENAGVTYALSSIGFFYALDPYSFTLSTELSNEYMSVYLYECGITVDGVDIDSVTVTVNYEDGEASAITFSYRIALLSDTSFEYTFYDFGNVSLELTEGGDNGDDEEPDYDPDEEKEIPEGYMTTLAKELSLLNYTLITDEMYYVDGEYIYSSKATYEFDGHIARFYLENDLESAEYLYEDFAGMAFATELLYYVVQLDFSKYECMGHKEYDGYAKATYEYNGAYTDKEAGVTLSNVTVYLSYENGVLSDVTICCTTTLDTEYGKYTTHSEYFFYDFGSTVVVSPKASTVVEFENESFDTENYSSSTTVTKSDGSLLNFSFYYDGNKYFVQDPELNYGDFYYTENAGLCYFLYYFETIFNTVSADDYSYDADYSDKNYYYVAIYTSGDVKKLSIPIGDQVYNTTVSGLKLSFFRNENGGTEKIKIEYSAVIDGEICNVSSVIAGFGTQTLIPPTERDFDFDTSNTDEICNKTLDNFYFSETVTKNGSKHSFSYGYFEKDFAKYDLGSGLKIGAENGKGKAVFDEKFGFLYSLDPELFVYDSATLTSVTFRYNGSYTAESGKISYLTVTLNYSSGAGELIGVGIKFVRTADSVNYYHEIGITSFGKVSIDRSEATKITIDEDAFNRIFNAEVIKYAHLSTITTKESGSTEIITKFSYDKYNNDYEITVENCNDFSQYKVYSYDSLDKATTGYEEHFAFFLEAMKLISPSKLVYKESSDAYRTSERVTYGEYTITSVYLRVSSYGQFTIQIYASGTNGSFTINASISFN